MCSFPQIVVHITESLCCHTPSPAKTLSPTPILPCPSFFGGSRARETVVSCFGKCYCLFLVKWLSPFFLSLSYYNQNPQTIYSKVLIFNSTCTMALQTYFYTIKFVQKEQAHSKVRPTLITRVMPECTA